MVVDYVPEGFYCYTRTGGHFKRCPYWNYVSEYNGYCALLDLDDEQIEREGYSGLLWDQVKVCGINEPD